MLDIALKRESLVLSMMVLTVDTDAKAERKERQKDVELLREGDVVKLREEEVRDAEQRKEDSADVNSNILLKYNFL